MTADGAGVGATGEIDPGLAGSDGNAPKPGHAAGPVLALEGVRLHFGGITALDGVDLAVHPGEVCGLIGPNGAGKTTLFDVISGVRVPNAGRVWFDGHDVTHWTAVRRARSGVRRTFQRAQTYSWLTVTDNVLTALEWRGGGGGLVADLVGFPARKAREKERRERVDAILEQCSLTHVRDQLAGALPIGLARMVELARALVDEPRLLLLDEPTSGLSDEDSGRLAQRIKGLQDTSGSPVLLVEHDVGFVMNICDRVVVLDRGRILAVGTPQEIQSNVAVRSAYLG